MKKPVALITVESVQVTAALRRMLVAQEYTVIITEDSGQQQDCMAGTSPDIIIASASTAARNDFEMLRQLRRLSAIPVIIVSIAKNLEEEIRCLNLGADDYLVWPFEGEELLARINAIRRRGRNASTPSTQPPFQCRGLEIDYASRTVTVNGRDAALTPTEYRLLEILTLKAGKTVSHQDLLRQVWGPEFKNDTHYLHAYVNTLRKKIDDNTHGYIINQSRIGYRFQDNPVNSR